MHIADHPNLVAAPLWERARAALARAFAALGGAAAIAAIRTLTPALRRRIVAWLCPLENIVRKLLLTEAGGIAHAAPRRPPALRKGGARAARAIDLSQPETWPARFSLAPPRDPRAVPDACAPRIRSLWGPPPPPAPRAPSAPGGETSAFRLARRFEALRRVLENPSPHARRLARLLQRLRRRFPEAVARYALAPARVSDFDAADPRLSADAYAAGFGGASRLVDTS